MAFFFYIIIIIYSHSGFIIFGTRIFLRKRIKQKKNFFFSSISRVYQICVTVRYCSTRRRRFIPPVVVIIIHNICILYVYTLITTEQIKRHGGAYSQARISNGKYKYSIT